MTASREGKGSKAWASAIWYLQTQWQQKVQPVSLGCYSSTFRQDSRSTGFLSYSSSSNSSVRRKGCLASFRVASSLPSAIKKEQSPSHRSPDGSEPLPNHLAAPTSSSSSFPLPSFPRGAWKPSISVSSVLLYLSHLCSLSFFFF